MEAGYLETSIAFACIFLF